MAASANSTPANPDDPAVTLDDGNDGNDGDAAVRIGGDATAVIRLERSLLDPRVRRDPEAVRALLHPDFSEFGASGQIWDADSVTEVLAAAPDQGPEPLTATDFRGHELAPGVLLLTFRTDRATVSCLRSSLWMRSGDRWLLRFHQATALPPEPPGRW